MLTTLYIDFSDTQGQAGIWQKFKLIRLEFNTGETAEIPEKPKNNRETLIGALIYIFGSAFLYSGHYRKWTLQNKNLKSLFQNYK